MTRSRMSKTGRAILCFLSILMFILFSGFYVSAYSDNGLKSGVSLNIAWETLHYKEHETDTNMNTEAKLNDLVVGLEGMKRWDQLFINIRIILPITGEKGIEEAGLSYSTYQRNELEASWVRLDGLVG